MGLGPWEFVQRTGFSVLAIQKNCKTPLKGITELNLKDKLFHDV